jgi:hypothetical protein
MKALNLLIVVVTNSFILSIALLMLSACMESDTANYKIARSWIGEERLPSAVSVGITNRYALNELSE